MSVFCVCARVCCAIIMHMRDGAVSILQYTLLSAWGKQYLHTVTHIHNGTFPSFYTGYTMYAYYIICMCILVCMHVESVDVWKQSATASYIFELFVRKGQTTTIGW